MSAPAQGDTVRLVHCYGREAVVSSVADGEVVVCMRIGHRYQLRGPFTFAEVEVVTPSSEATR